jgi:hypothetical protein
MESLTEFPRLGVFLHCSGRFESYRYTHFLRGFMKKKITFEYDLDEIKRLRTYFWNLELKEEVPLNIPDYLDALDRLLVTLMTEARDS